MLQTFPMRFFGYHTTPETDPGLWIVLRKKKTPPLT